jgi:tight adherence protein C
LARFLSAIGMRANPGKSADDMAIKLKFLKAGLRGQKRAHRVLGHQAASGRRPAPGFSHSGSAFFQNRADQPPAAGRQCFMAIAGPFLPDRWLRSERPRARRKLTKAFPDMLDLLVVCVEAGMGLDAAISRVGEELGLSHPELSQELKLLNLELRAGKPRQTALRNLASRTDIDDVNSLVTLLIQTDRFGTSVAQALKVFADSFRTARFQRAEEFAAKIATKLIFPLALGIFPCFFIVVLGPVAIQVYRMFYQG